MEQQEQQELTREQRLEIEDKAIQALLSMGAKFTVPVGHNRVVDDCNGGYFCHLGYVLE